MIRDGDELLERIEAAESEEELRALEREIAGSEDPTIAQAAEALYLALNPLPAHDGTPVNLSFKDDGHWRKQPRWPKGAVDVHGEPIAGRWRDSFGPGLGHLFTTASGTRVFGSAAEAWDDFTDMGDADKIAFALDPKPKTYAVQMLVTPKGEAYYWRNPDLWGYVTDEFDTDSSQQADVLAEIGEFQDSLDNPRSYLHGMYEFDKERLHLEHMEDYGLPEATDEQKAFLVGQHHGDYVTVGNEYIPTPNNEYAQLRQSMRGIYHTDLHKGIPEGAEYSNHNFFVADDGQIYSWERGTHGSGSPDEVVPLIEMVVYHKPASEARIRAKIGSGRRDALVGHYDEDLERARIEGQPTSEQAQALAQQMPFAEEIRVGLDRYSREEVLEDGLPDRSYEPVRMVDIRYHQWDPNAQQQDEINTQLPIYSDPRGLRKPEAASFVMNRDGETYWYENPVDSDGREVRSWSVRPRGFVSYEGITQAMFPHPDDPREMDDNILTGDVSSSGWQDWVRVSPFSGSLEDSTSRLPAALTSGQWRSLLEVMPEDMRYSFDGNPTKPPPLDYRVVGDVDGTPYYDSPQGVIDEDPTRQDGYVTMGPDGRTFFMTARYGNGGLDANYFAEQISSEHYYTNEMVEHDLELGRKEGGAERPDISEYYVTQLERAQWRGFFHTRGSGYGEVGDSPTLELSNEHEEFLPDEAWDELEKYFKDWRILVNGMMHDRETKYRPLEREAAFKATRDRYRDWLRDWEDKHNTVRDWLSEDQKEEWQAHQDRRHSVHTYNSHEYARINGELRRAFTAGEDYDRAMSFRSGHGNYQNLREIVMNLEQTIESSPGMPVDITLMRGMDWREINRRYDSGDLIGFEYQDGGFVSMTTDESTAEHFRRGGGVIAFITVPAGEKFAFLGGMTETSGEEEFLFRREMKFRVTDAWEDDRGNRWLRVEIVRDQEGA